MLTHTCSVPSGIRGEAPLLFPTDLASFLDLIRQHGDAAYSVMFAYAGSHSLLFALFAGYAAHSGALQLGTLILVCWFGSFAYGMSRLPWPTFLAINFIAAGVWSCTVVLAGYAFGHVSEKLMSDASSGIGSVMLVVFLGLSWILTRKLERVVERS
jgi:membrane protein DedA with SNARE-associated domain